MQGTSMMVSTGTNQVVEFYTCTLVFIHVFILVFQNDRPCRTPFFLPSLPSIIHVCIHCFVWKCLIVTV